MVQLIWIKWSRLAGFLTAGPYIWWLSCRALYFFKHLVINWRKLCLLDQEIEQYYCSCLKRCIYSHSSKQTWKYLHLDFVVYLMKDRFKTNRRISLQTTAQLFWHSSDKKIMFLDTFSFVNNLELINLLSNCDTERFVDSLNYASFRVKRKGSLADIL